MSVVGWLSLEVKETTVLASRNVEKAFFSCPGQENFLICPLENLWNGGIRTDVVLGLFPHNIYGMYYLERRFAADMF
jgi:hypothetical protein